MIIFDLDTLADDTHRRHFIDPEYREGCNHWHSIPNHPVDMCLECKKRWYQWQPDYNAYNAACGDDVPIIPTLMCLSKYRQTESVRIWTSRCESLKYETIRWFINKWYVGDYLGIVSDWLYDFLKMRPIGNTEPAHVLKEQWLNEYMKWPLLEPITPENESKIYKRNDLPEFVFDADPDSIAMFRRRGVYVFDCRQE